MIEYKRKYDGINAVTNINLGAPKEYEPSEWMVDEQGRRYRMIGSCKEYEMIVIIDGYPVPQSQVAEFHRRRKELQNKK